MSYASWSVAEVGEWLGGQLSMPETVVASFRENAVSGEGEGFGAAWATMAQPGDSTRVAQQHLCQRAAPAAAARVPPTTDPRLLPLQSWPACLTRT